MAPTTIRAKKTEALLRNRFISCAMLSFLTLSYSAVDEQWLRDGLASLAKEMKLPAGVPGGMERYRTSLAMSFFFKYAMEMLNTSQLMTIEELPSSDFASTQVYRVSFP